MNSRDFVTALRSAAPYVHRHRGAVCVVAFGGEIAQREDFNALIYDLALLHSLGMQLVLVHGARPQIESQMAAAGLAPQYAGEYRITDAAALECSKQAAGALRLEIEARLSTSLANTPMSGARIQVAGGNWITARPVGVRDGVDYQHTGEVRSVDADSIRKALGDERIALISPLAYARTGEIFNLRASELATAVAIALDADKLIFVSASNPREWHLAQDAGDAGQLSTQAAQTLLAKKTTLDTQDRRYLRAALAAVNGGVRRVHLVAAQTQGVLLRELFTRDGRGLMIYADAHYEAVHQAGIEDVGGILALIEPLEQSGVLVPRSREQLELEIGNFDVMLRDGLVIACCALFPFAENAMAELACVAVHPDYRKSGRAGALLQRAEARARQQGLRRLFTLTTHTPHWFIEHGFEKASLDALPMARQRIYNFQRNSTVLIKSL